MQLKPLDKIQYVPLRVRQGKVYYFAEDGLIHTRSTSRIPERIREYYLEMYKKEMFYVRKAFTADEYISEHLSHFVLDEVNIVDFDKEEKFALQLRKAMAKLKQGDSYDTVNEYIRESTEYYKSLYKIMAEKKGVYHDRPEGLERFIVKVLKPVILRVPENDNPKTFDIIKVQMDIISQWETDRTKYIKDNRKEIIRRAVEKIAQDNTFKKFGVDVNILALTKILRLNDNMIELIFELKKELKGINKKDGDSKE